MAKKKIEGESRKLFLARINKRGKANWVNTIPFYNAASGYLLDTDKKGNIILGGVFADTLICETGNLVSHGHNDMFIAQFTPDGAMEQVIQLGNKGKEKLSAMAIDSLNNIYLAGNHERSFSARNVEIAAMGEKQKGNAFLLQLDSTLAATWAKPLSSPSYVNISGLACNQQNQLLMSGNFDFTLNIDSLQYQTNGYTDFFVCKADTAGNLNWLKTFGGKYTDRSKNLKLNKLGGAMVTGSFNDTIYMDSLMLNTHSLNSEAFIAQLDTTGFVTWAEAMHGKGGSTSNGGALDNKGNLYLMGSFNGSLQAGGTELATLGEEDIFVAKYYNCPPVANAINSPGYLCQGQHG